jgi:hypothetical protein
MNAQKNAVIRNFKHATTWGCAKFLEEAAKQNVDLSSSSPDFGTLPSKQTKSTCKNVLSILLTYATTEEMASLEPTTNADTVAVAKNIEKYKTVAEAIAAKAIADLEQREAARKLRLATAASALPSGVPSSGDGGGASKRRRAPRAPSKTVGSVAKRFLSIKKSEEHFAAGVKESDDDDDDDGGEEEEEERRGGAKKLPSA